MPQIILHPDQARPRGASIDPRWVLVILAIGGAAASGLLLLLPGLSPQSSPATSFHTDSLLVQMGWVRYLLLAAIVLGLVIAFLMPFYPDFHFLRRDPAALFTTFFPIMFCFIFLAFPLLTDSVNGIHAVHRGDRYYILNNLRTERQITESEYREMHQAENQATSARIHRGGLIAAALTFTSSATYSAWWMSRRRGS